jgi:hypothetical protein
MSTRKDLPAKSHLLQMFGVKPMTWKEMVSEFGICKNSAYKIISILRSDLYILEWVPPESGSKSLPRYAWKRPVTGLEGLSLDDLTVKSMALGMHAEGLLTPNETTILLFEIEAVRKPVPSQQDAPYIHKRVKKEQAEIVEKPEKLNVVRLPVRKKLPETFSHSHPLSQAWFGCKVA